MVEARAWGGGEVIGAAADVKVFVSPEWIRGSMNG
jgi:hypothetical protein